MQWRAPSTLSFAARASGNGVSRPLRSAALAAIPAVSSRAPCAESPPPASTSARRGLGFAILIQGHCIKIAVILSGAERVRRRRGAESKDPVLIRLFNKLSALNGEAQFGVPRLRGSKPPEGGTPNSFGNQPDRHDWKWNRCALTFLLQLPHACMTTAARLRANFAP